MDALSPTELEAEARDHLDPAAYDFFAGGAGEEVTLRQNTAAFARLGLVPRVLRGGGMRELGVTVLGAPMSMPVLLAPTAFHRLACEDGEAATARAAATAGVVMIVSMASTVAIERIAEAAREAVAGPAPQLWFQLYIQPDRGFTASVVRRAQAAGCRALVVTVDSPVFGHRERDLRNGFLDLPAGVQCENLREPSPAGGWGPARDIEFDPGLSWADLDWLRSVTELPIVLKGVLHPADARLAVGCGADALIVSNHGGRQLDTVAPTIDLLPAVADAVGGALPVLLDGGVRRGVDVVKACALGASAVGVGRSVLWGLATGGEAGVRRVLETLRRELDSALALCGCDSPGELTPDLVRKAEQPWWS
ncbi:MAG: alpha-hydroxy-acid oxidizing protein [Actinophytocola sp.]|uniref:alpha-hydroxy acid oxidase n=1 Tax=Actinophytocola sp. TaxID=1872138 RepID=UPI001327A39E|nr:alpha-hydroxy acid oxidase [Actinophytocola sp.]MPZ81898.1 alpha-hydroxy-acid oxidizing protein [Actinophytocola sp.]